MIDCINDEDSSVNESINGEDEEETNKDETFLQDEIEEPPRSSLKGRKQRSVRTKLQSSVAPSIPSTPSKQQQASSLLEYVVDQKGTGSETLVVKSASIAGSSSASNGSRRNSITGSHLSPKRSTAIPNNFSPFNPNYCISKSVPVTTQSHPLFPNYPRANYNLGNALPSLETQFDFNVINGGDLGLTALNVNDFNLLGIWNNNNYSNNSSYFNSFPQSDIPRYSQQSTPQSQLNPHNAIPSSTSQNPINNIVSDLFGDISNMF